MKNPTYIYPSDFPTTEQALRFFCRYGMKVELSLLGSDNWEALKIVKPGEMTSAYAAVKKYAGFSGIRAPRLSHEDIIGLGWEWDELDEWYLLKSWRLYKDIDEENKWVVHVGDSVALVAIPTAYDLQEKMQSFGIKAEETA